LPQDQEQLMRALHDEHAGALWGYCLHLTDRDPVRAQDVCQETLLRAWQHPDVLAKPPSLARGWLFTVARNIVIDEWRARRVRPEIVTAEPPDAPHEQHEIDQKLQAWVVAEAMRKLSQEHREILYECYYQGRTVADAARRLDIPEGTVKSRCHYALRALRLALEELGVTR